MIKENYSDILKWLSLSLIFPADSSILWKLYSKHHSCERILSELLSCDMNGLPPYLCKRISSFNKNCVEDIALYCERNNIEIITYDNSDYPESFKNISCPPAVIYCRGKASVLSSIRALAVVGARKADDYSLKAADIFSYEAARNGITVVSGFANGIDSAAHKGAIKAKGETVAVLGCGIDYDYPKGKSDFKRSVTEYGAVISEFPPLAQPEPNNFRVRNRLISALSDKILVVQADRRSGALNTVSHGLEQGKDIYVIPPRDIFRREYEGQSLLIKDGAQPVFSPHDILIDF